MNRKRKDADGLDRTGRRGDANLMAREAGFTLQEIAGRFRVTASAVGDAIKRAEARHSKRTRAKRGIGVS